MSVLVETESRDQLLARLMKSIEARLTPTPPAVSKPRVLPPVAPPAGCIGGPIIVLVAPLTLRELQSAGNCCSPSDVERNLLEWARENDDLATIVAGLIWSPDLLLCRWRCLSDTSEWAAMGS